MSEFASSPKKNRVLRAAIVAAVIAGFVAVLVYRNAIDAASVVAWAQNQSWWATALEFLVVHMAAGLVFVPRLIMGLAAGVLFGPLWGSVLSLIGGTLSSFTGFVLVRFVNADSVRLREAPAIGPWLDKAEAQGWRLVFIVRLIPVLPHSLVNYVFGLSRMSTRGYLLGSALGMVPTSVVYANLGASGRSIAESGSDLSNYALMAAWGFGLIFVSWLLPKAIQKFYPHEGAGDGPHA